MNHDQVLTLQPLPCNSGGQRVILTCSSDPTTGVSISHHGFLHRVAEFASIIACEASRTWRSSELASNSETSLSALEACMRPRVVRRFLLACASANAFESVPDCALTAIQWHSIQQQAEQSGAAVTAAVETSDLEELSFLRKKLVAWRIQSTGDELNADGALSPEVKSLLHQYDALLRRRGVMEASAMSLSASGGAGPALKRTGMLSSMAAITSLLAECRTRLTSIAAQRQSAARAPEFPSIDRSAASTLQGSAVSHTHSGMGQPGRRLAAAHAPRILLLAHVLGCSSVAEQAAHALQSHPEPLLSEQGPELMQCIPRQYMQGILTALAAARTPYSVASSAPPDICDDVSSIGSARDIPTASQTQGADCRPEVRGHWQRVSSPLDDDAVDPDDEALWQAVSSSMRAEGVSPTEGGGGWHLAGNGGGQQHDTSSDSRSTVVEHASPSPQPPSARHAPQESGVAAAQSTPETQARTATLGGSSSGTKSRGTPASGSRLPRRLAARNTPGASGGGKNSTSPSTAPACTAAASPPEGTSKVQWARQQAAARAKRLAAKRAAQAREQAQREREEQARLAAFKAEMEQERQAKLQAFKQRTEAQRRKEQAAAAAAAREAAAAQQQQQRRRGAAAKRGGAHKPNKATQRRVPPAEAAAAAAQRVAQRRAAQAEAAAAAAAEREAAAAAAHQANARQQAAARLKESRDRMAELIAREEAEKAAARTGLFARRDARLAKWKQARRQRAHLQRGRAKRQPASSADSAPSSAYESDASVATVDSVDIAAVAQRAAARALEQVKDVSPGKQAAAARDAAHTAVREAKRQAQWAAYAATDSFNVSVASVRDVYASDTEQSEDDLPAPPGRRRQACPPPAAPPARSRPPPTSQSQSSTTAAGSHSRSALGRLRSKRSPHKGAQATTAAPGAVHSLHGTREAPVAQAGSAQHQHEEHTAPAATAGSVLPSLPPGDELQHFLGMATVSSAGGHPVARSVPERLRTSILAATIVEGSSLEDSSAMSTAHSHSSSSAAHMSHSRVSSSGVGVAGPSTTTPARQNTVSGGTRASPFTPYSPLEGGMDTFLEAEARAQTSRSHSPGSAASAASLQYSPLSPETATPPAAAPAPARAPISNDDHEGTPCKLNDSSASGVDALNSSIRSLHKLPRAPSAPRLPDSRSSTPQAQRGEAKVPSRQPFDAAQRELLFETDMPTVDDSVDLLNVSLPATSSLQQPKDEPEANRGNAAPSQRRRLGSLSSNTVHSMGAVSRKQATPAHVSGGAGLLADDSFTAMLQSMQ